jgi:streptogramin lyase
MRKIEKEMNYAIAQGRNWSSANTMVRVEPETRESNVYLHGHHIATVEVHKARLGLVWSCQAKSRNTRRLADEYDEI